jgi:succinate dehydrogenase/fumarate reductase cytochrome b subunit
MGFINIAYASGGESLDQFIRNVDNYIINPLIILLFALAIAYFLWGIFEFLSNADNEEKRTSGKKHMLFGVIGITIMMAVWTLLSIILNTLGISSEEINPQNGTVRLNEYTPSEPSVP